MFYKQWMTITLLLLLLGSGSPTLIQGRVWASDSAPALQLIDHIGGATTAFALHDDVGYLGFSFEFVVLDLADRTQPRPVARLPIATTAIALVKPYAYVVGRGGLTILDITKPSEPIVLGKWSDGGALADIAVADGYAYIVSYDDLFVIAVADSHRPTLAAHRSFPVRFEGIAVDGNVAYATSHSGLHQLDITQPTNPTERLFVPTGDAPNGTPYIQDAIYFAVGGSLYRAGRSSTLSITDTLLIGGWLAEAVVEDGIAYLANGSNGVQIWDIRDWDQPKLLGTVPARGIVSSVLYGDGYLYVIDCDEGLTIYDTADPTALALVGAYQPLGTTHQLAVDDTYAYVISGFHGGLHRLDATASTPFQMTASVLGFADLLDVALSGDLLYMIDGFLLRIVDLSPTTEPVVLRGYGAIGEDAIHIQDHFAYLSDSHGNLRILDLTVPEQPQPVATYPEIGYVKAMAATQEYLYVPHKDYGLRIFALETDGALRQVGHLPITNSIKKVVVQDGIGYLALGRQGLLIVDLTNPALPQALALHRTSGDAVDVAVVDNYAFVAADKAGVEVIDISDPAAPLLVDSHPTLDCAHQVIAANGRLYVADRMGGLFVFATSQW